MLNRRTFLKLSAGALALAAAGALTGCGGTTVDNRAKVEIDGVTFLCSNPLGSGGEGYQVQYKPVFEIQNSTAQQVTIPAEDITGVFTDPDGTQYPMEFIRKSLTVDPKSSETYTTQRQFCLETENRVPVLYSTGTYELRVKYHGQTAVFFYDGKTIAARKE